MKIKRETIVSSYLKDEHGVPLTKEVITADYLEELAKECAPLLAMHVALADVPLEQLIMHSDRLFPLIEKEINGND